MNNTRNTPKMEGQHLGLFIFECVMAVLYLVFAAVFLFTPLFSGAISGWVRITLGVLFGLYGVFRIFRAIRKIAGKNR